ncbi:polyprenyl synthetase family protein [Brevibacterium otitidis]|uniref:Polyprenyl synthetase family protein n=1 Tax=Brevibacterium otitidis TaxID=53364 RepID=A0ABV5X8I4_9MICO|nr:polyprenyl synthetase family protein [Brevibacterium otitidis]
MTTTASTVAALTPAEEVIAAVDRVIDAHLQATAERMAETSPVTSELIEPIRTFSAKGKRVRALIAWWGYELAGGTDAAASGIAQTAAGVEMLHAAALIHDDIIDASETRRGQPAVHTAFRAMHRDRSWSGDAKLFGDGAAIIAGDLCLSLSEELFSASALAASATAEAVRRHDDFRRDVMVGQYLDIRLQAAPVTGAELLPRAEEVLTYKSAKYSVEQPLLLGAALAGAGPELLEALSDFGLPLGRAFQLRDDELGVFGDPALTGKPAGDDLRQGKKTVLIGLTLAALADGDAQAAEQASWLMRRLGQPDLSLEELQQMNDLIRSCGALQQFEAEIDAQLDATHRGLDALAAHGIGDAARQQLAQYALMLTRRSA